MVADSCCRFLLQIVIRFYSIPIISIIFFNFFGILDIIDDYDILAANRKIFQEYFAYSTIQGLVYIFAIKISWFGRGFWILAFLLMMTLGTYLSAAMYVNWRSNQVDHSKYFKTLKITVAHYNFSFW